MASMLTGQVPTSNALSRPISGPICRQKDLPKPRISRRYVTFEFLQGGGAEEQRDGNFGSHLPLQVTSGTKPNYLGVQKNPPSLALCPATNNCTSTSEEKNDLKHYAPPWNYNPQDGRKKKTISRDEAMAQLLQVVESIKPDNFTPHVVEKRKDYIRVEYESPIMGFVDDVEFWFPPGNKSVVEYRSASRLGNFDFDINRKRIKALRLELEKKGWASESDF